MLKGRDIPQKDRLDHIRRTVQAVHDGAATAMSVGEATGLGARHGGYALHTARVLGWLAETDAGHSFCSTDSGRALLGTKPNSKDELRAFRSAVTDSPIVRLLAPTLLETPAPDLDALVRSICRQIDLSESTARRRAQTLLSWWRQLHDSPIVEQAETGVPVDASTSADSAVVSTVPVWEPALTTKTRQIKIRELVDLKREGKLFLPDLQRSFVWNNERVRALHDSLYRGFPIGVLLLWRPVWENGDETPLCTKSWDLCPPNAEGKGIQEAHPQVRPGAVFVLDGQQRLTSLFRVIFKNRSRGKKIPNPDLRVALSSADEWLKEPYCINTGSLLGRMKDGLVVPAEVLFANIRGEGHDSSAVRKALGEWVVPDTEPYHAALDRAEAIRNSILNAEILAYEIDADIDDENVIELFARLNLMGVRLRPSDLASARLTGAMGTFRNRARDSLADPEFRNFSVNDEAAEDDAPRTGSYVDTDLLMRAAFFHSTSLLRFRDIEKKRRMEGARGPYTRVEASWNAAADGLKESVSILRAAGVPSGAWVPYRNVLLIPGIAAAAGKLHDRKWWLGWMLAASLWGHYAGSTDSKAQADANRAKEGKYDELLKSIMNTAKRTGVIPDEADFTQNIVRADGLLLALLVNLHRKDRGSFPSGARFKGTDDPVQVHHIFPRAYLNEEVDDAIPDRLGNLTPLHSRDNKSISAAPPAAYLAELVRCGKAQQLEQHDIPEDPELWQPDRYEDFCEEREKRLARTVRALLQDLLNIS